MGTPVSDRSVDARQCDALGLYAGSGRCALPVGHSEPNDSRAASACPEAEWAEEIAERWHRIAEHYRAESQH